MAEHGKNGADGIDAIVEKLSPSRIAEEVTLPHRTIRNKWQIKTPKISDYNSFKKGVIEYVQHHWKEFYKGQISDHSAFGEAIEALDARFRNEGGWQHAFGLASEGKFDDVINALASHFEATETRHYITLHSTTDPNDLESRTKVVTGIMEQLKPHLPKGTKLQKPEFYARESDQLVQLYSNAINQLIERLAKKGTPDAKEPAYAGGGGHAGH